MSRSKLRSILLASVLACSVPAITACNSTTSNSETTNRSQLLLTDSAELQAQADKAYAEVIAEAKAKGTLNTNKAQYNRVKKIADRLIKVAPRFRADAADWKWEVNVITENTLNAWCMPGGKIAVYSGLIDQLKLTDDEIATVMGHEIAHALREHSREQQSTEMLKNGAIGIAQLFGVSDTAIAIGQTAATAAISLPFSRAHETEADELGLELMYDAGFNPDSSISLWEKMMKATSGQQSSALGDLLSTHPSDEKRLANLRQLIDKLKASHAAQGKK